MPPPLMMSTWADTPNEVALDDDDLIVEDARPIPIHRQHVHVHERHRVAAYGRRDGTASIRDCARVLSRVSLRSDMDVQGAERADDQKQADGVFRRKLHTCVIDAFE